MDWRTRITPESWRNSLKGFFDSVRTFPFPFDDDGCARRSVYDILTRQQIALPRSFGRQNPESSPIDFRKQSNALLRLLDGLTVAYGVMSRPRRRARGT
ncbi:hypothetical protein BDZ89DRAFT_1059488 [Hymenopellis radicata]|nr:hypothetical protein BDZ89DRAFT_1059488 [Hymenopellis radicata]